MPICETLFEFVTGKIDKNQALTKIMTRPLSEEI
jgi:hypothetical protein